MEYVPYVAIAIAFALVHLPRFVVGREMKLLAGGYDNRDPRGQQLQLAGVGKRALAAHHNGFEAFAPFAVGALAAVQRGASRDLISVLCIVFVIARAVYVWAYINDRAPMRSSAWTLGMIAIGLLMILAIVGPR